MAEVEHRHERESAMAVYQTLRETVTNLDSILVTLLTQGNTFVIAILSLPIIANLHGVPAAGVCLFALFLGLFFLLANLLYSNLLTRSVRVARQLEETELCDVCDAFYITKQLDKTPLSAERGSFLIYLVLPAVLVIAAVCLGVGYLAAVSPVWVGGFVLVCLVVLLSAVVVYAMYVRRGVPQ